MQADHCDPVISAGTDMWIKYCRSRGEMSISTWGSLGGLRKVVTFE